MTGIVVLLALALTIVAVLGHISRQPTRSRRVLRTKLDLFAAAGSAQPFAHKPLRNVPPRDHHRLAA